MTSQVSIANQALIKIGAERIISIDEDTKQARILKALWDIKRDAELAAHPWTFATKRARLPASSTAPAFGFSRAFPLPVDALRLVEVGQWYVMYQGVDNGPIFAIEGGEVLCDEASPLDVRYVARVNETARWPALFCEALACRLAAEMVESMTQSLGKRQQAWDEYKAAVLAARRANAIEQPPQPTPANAWWLARQ
jgi:hypothetical protein